MTKLIYDHQIFQAQRYGGISRYFYELISRAAISPKLQVALFSGWNINQYGLETLRSTYSGYFGIKRSSHPRIDPFFSLLNKTTFPLFLKKNNPQIYHSTYYALLAPSFKGMRVVTVYDMIHELFPHLVGKGDKATYRKKASVMAADRIIAISESTKQDLIRLYKIPPEKITVTYLANGLKCHIPSKNQNIIGAPYILYVGDRKSYKNFARILSAIAASPWIRKEFKLVCFGGGPLSSEEIINIGDLGLQNNIVYQQGRDETLSALYQQASVFVYPSLYEGFGLPPLEAMGHGCPVIVSSKSSLPEVVGDGGLYADPDSTEEWVEQLTRLLTDKSLRSQMIVKGHEQEKKFSWDRCFSETQAIYLG